MAATSKKDALRGFEQTTLAERQATALEAYTQGKRIEPSIYYGLGALLTKHAKPLSITGTKLGQTIRLSLYEKAAEPSHLEKAVIMRPFKQEERLDSIVSSITELSDLKFSLSHIAGKFATLHSVLPPLATGDAAVKEYGREMLLGKLSHNKQWQDPELFIHGMRPNSSKHRLHTAMFGHRLAYYNLHLRDQLIQTPLTHSGRTLQTIVNGRAHAGLVKDTHGDAKLHNIFSVKYTERADVTPIGSYDKVEWRAFLIDPGQETYRKQDIFDDYAMVLTDLAGTLLFKLLQSPDPIHAFYYGGSDTSRPVKSRPLITAFNAVERAVTGLYDLYAADLHNEHFDPDKSKWRAFFKTNNHFWGFDYTFDINDVHHKWNKDNRAFMHWLMLEKALVCATNCFSDDNEPEKGAAFLCLADMLQYSFELNYIHGYERFSRHSDGSETTRLLMPYTQRSVTDTIL